MEVKVYATLRDVVGGASARINDASDKITVKEMLDDLVEQYPQLQAKLLLDGDNLHPAMHILINGRDMRYIDGLDTVITAEDEVRIFPPVGGGSR